MNELKTTGIGKRKINRKKRSRYIFCLVMAAIPVVQFLLMYIGVRFQSFVLAFQHYEKAAGGFGYDITFAGFDNFSRAIVLFEEHIGLFKNSAILFALTTLIGISLALIFSFYIYKKYLFSGLFKTVLFMPQIISSLIFATIFRYIVTDGYMYLMEEWTGKQVLGLLDNADTRFGVLIFFNIWTSFGVNVLMYSGAMSGINESIVESARLDGANIVQEFIHITIPLIYPTITTFLILSFVGMFTSDYGLLDLLGTSAIAISNVGHWLYSGSLAQSYVEEFGSVSLSVLSACGLLLTLIVTPITIICKKLLEKYGPSVD